MNQKEKINLIESKIKEIKEIKSTLSLWTKNIETYYQQLQELTNQLKEIKLQIKENKK